MSRTDRHYFLIRKPDVGDVEAFHADERFGATAEEDGWLFARLHTPDGTDEIAADHLEGWGDAFYARDPIGGGGAFRAYRHGEYGVERIASNGNRGGYHYVRKYILGHNAINTDPPESIPTGQLHDDR